MVFPMKIFVKTKMIQELQLLLWELQSTQSVKQYKQEQQLADVYSNLSGSKE